MLENPRDVCDLAVNVVGNVTYRVDQRYVSFSARSVLCAKATDSLTGCVVLIHRNEVLPYYKECMRYLKRAKLQSYYNHEHILRVKAASLASPSGELYLVTDFMQTTLQQVIRSSQTLTDDHCRYLIYQVLLAVYYVHSSNTVILNINPNNIYVNEDCSVKLDNFEYARDVDTKLPVKSKESTYEGPEILLGNIGVFESDIWSVGCILLELFLRRRLFQHGQVKRRLQSIFEFLGKPIKEEMEVFKNELAISYMNELPDFPKVDLKDRLPNANPLAVDLLQNMMTISPYKRYSAKQCIEHPYFFDLFSREDLISCSPVDWEHFRRLETLERVQESLNELSLELSDRS